ncbi:MAG: hypothetical protein AAFX06_33540, partial [Planctomycetota bacterium]
MAKQTDLETICRGIEQAGSMDAYIDAQLRERGFLVERRDTDNMSRRELARYKKELKDEAEEKRKLKAAAWKAYRHSHIVFLGEGVQDFAPVISVEASGAGRPGNVDINTPTFILS